MISSKNKILFIDDHYDLHIHGINEVAKAYSLETIGYSSIEVGIMNLDDKVGVVLLDLSFSPGNHEGKEGLQKIKNKFPQLPVIILTGKSPNDIGMAVDCMKLGAINFILKTNFTYQSLVYMANEAIKQYMNYLECERKKRLKEEYNLKIGFYEKMLNVTEMIVKQILKDKLMFPPTIEKRVKDFESLYKKILDKETNENEILEPFKRFSDIAGLRFVFYNATDLQIAVDLIQKSDDFISINENENLNKDDKRDSLGYRAVHFDVLINSKKRKDLIEYKEIIGVQCEIQFKTIFAHSWSKIFHEISYKKNEKSSANFTNQLLLKEDFCNAAEKLEEIEKQITDICNKHINSNNDC